MQQKLCCTPGVPTAGPTPELQGQGWHLGLLCCSLGDKKHEMGQKRMIGRGVPMSPPWGHSQLSPRGVAVQHGDISRGPQPAPSVF